MFHVSKATAVLIKGGNIANAWQKASCWLFIGVSGSLTFRLVSADVVLWISVELPWSEIGTGQRWLGHEKSLSGNIGLAVKISLSDWKTNICFVSNSQTQLDDDDRIGSELHWLTELGLSSSTEREESHIRERIWRICSATHNQGTA